MEALALYLIKSTVWLTGFALVYLLFLRNERFFVLNRIYLVSGIIVSIVFPLFTWHYTVMLPNAPTVEVSDLQMVGTVDIPQPFPTQAILLYIYLAGALYLLFRVIRQTRTVLKVIRKSEILPYRSAKLIRTTDYPASFSFFSFVFVNPSTCDTETNEIVNHELEHIRQQHWIDLLLFEFLLILQWFNPVSWLYGRFIRQNHEYLADERALQRSTNPAIYRAALLNQLFGGPVIALANSFNYSINKKRFNMMKQTIYSPIRKLKLLLILPLMAGVFYAFAAPEYKYDNGTENQDPKQALYSIAKDKIDISFTPQLEKSDLEAIKANLAKLGITIDYTSLDFSENGKLKQISASIKNKDGSGVTFTSGILDPTYYPRYQMDSNGRFGVFNQRNLTEKVLDEERDTLKGSVTNLKGNFVAHTSKDTTLAPGLSYTATRILGKINLKNRNENINADTISLDFTKTTSLFFIDGKESRKADVEKLNPDRIESVSILKDGSAINKYGNKGKNGVVQITTKKGLYSFKNEPIDHKVNGFDNAQKVNNKKESRPYTIVEQMPTFPGGAEALRTYLATNVKYPAIAVEKGIQGKVYISFVVTKTGSVTNAKVVRGVDPSLDHEAIRVIESMPTWNPGKQNGENVDIPYTVPINFVLDPSKISTEKLKGTDNPSDQPYSVVEQMPEFPGGDEALRKFMADNIKYPSLAHEKGIEGKVFINFVVTKTGNVTHAKVVRSVDPLLDNEAIRVVELLPTWKPGKQNGKIVDVEYTIPINFKLEKATEKEIKPQGDLSVLKNKLIIVPNPTQDKATITLAGSDSTNKLEVSIIDNFGNLISKESKNGPTFTLSVAKLTAGIYSVVVNDVSTQYQGQLVVNH